MKTNSKHSTVRALAIAAGAAAVALVMSLPAHAIQFSINVDVGNDGSWEYQNTFFGATPGTIVVPSGPFVPGLICEGSAHTSIQNNPLNILLSGTSVVNNTTGGVVRVYAEVSDVGFGPVANLAEITGSGTFTNAVGGTLIMNWYNDPSNGQGAPGTPGVLLGSYSYTASLANDSFSYNKSFGVFDPDLYSMTMSCDLVLPNNGFLTSHGQSESKTPVPEPSTILLLGCGLLGLGLMRRGKRMQ